MKKHFQAIIILMTISLFGIILVQTLWIRKSIRAEEERFDKAVYSALSNTVLGLEKRQIFHFIDKKIMLPPPKSTRPLRVLAKPPKRSKLHEERIGSLDSIEKETASIIIFADSGRNSRTVIRVTNEDTSAIFDGIDWNFIPGNNLIDEDSLYYFSKKTDSLQIQLEIEREELRWEQEKLVREKMEEFNESMEQWVYEYSFGDNDMLSDFLKNNIDSIISGALANNGIKIPFLTQIILERKDSSEILWPKTSVIKHLKQPYKTELFPNDFFRKNLFLVLDFPGKKAHIYRSVAFILLGSILFTLIILVTFGFTLFFIQKQKKLSDIKSDFISNMTHEFKTPIATISLASDALASPKVFGKKESTDYYLDIIRQENKRMNMQVEKVLQMSLIESEDFRLDIRLVNLHQLIEKVAHAAQLTAMEKKGRIVTVLKAVNSSILGDELHLANIFTNLVDNALKYTSNSPEILIETFNHNEMISIRVSDNGEGMNKDIQKHIFDKFYRKPSGNIHNVKGFGLGLSYVKAIVEKHKGTIDVSSEPGSGSIFTLSFHYQQEEL